MSQPLRQTLTFDTFEEFLDWERQQEVRHELVNGVPVAMAGASEAHNIIQGNLFAYLHGKLRGGPCLPFTSDMAMQTGVKHGRYPDVTVDCGQRHLENRAAPQPVVVFEVLSPDTQHIDWRNKLWEYNDIRSIAHYVLVEQSEYLVYIYSRSANGNFPLRPREIRGLDAVLELPAINVSMPLSEIYDRLDLEGNPDPDAPPPTRSPWHS